jgi:hypothetical protein
MTDFFVPTSDATVSAASPAVPRQEAGPPGTTPGRRDAPGDLVVRRSGTRWQVAGEELPDLLSAMILADLLAPDLPCVPRPGGPDPAGIDPADTAGAGDTGDPGDLAAEAARLRVTVAQLEHALATRVRVEQAIGIVAERRRIAPREAFALLRTVARADGVKVAELATRVVDSAVNQLLVLPEELARPPRQPRVRGRSPRHFRVSE